MQFAHLFKSEVVHGGEDSSSCGGDDGVSGAANAASNDEPSPSPPPLPLPIEPTEHANSAPSSQGWHDADEDVTTDVAAEAAPVVPSGVSAAAPVVLSGVSAAAPVVLSGVSAQPTAAEEDSDGDDDDGSDGEGMAGEQLGELSAAVEQAAGSKKKAKKKKKRKKKKKSGSSAVAVAVAVAVQEVRASMGEMVAWCCLARNSPYLPPIACPCMNMVGPLGNFQHHTCRAWCKT
jgi:hypothetical protein